VRPFARESAETPAKDGTPDCSDVCVHH